MLSSLIPSLGPMAMKFLQVAPPVAAQVVFLAPLQVMRKIRAAGTVGSMTPLPYTAMLTNGCLWMLYGGLCQNLTIVVPNISCVAFGAYYVATFARYTPRSAMIPHYIGGASIIASAATLAAVLPTPTAINALGIMGCTVVVVMFSGPLAVFRTVIREKSTDSMHFGFTIAAFVNCVAWVSYGVVINDIYLYLPNGLGLFSTIVQLFLFARYGRRVLPMKNT
eukprot:c2173_g1_i1.p1 GENE.c2173_g1_i1~~c2173_g1_i1.p1  ORF type:complete len:222 (-),score=48.22 c2173_g1_i1:65-730(-)